ncbi:helix-turn-helix domain-containing protein [Streptomyces sp. NPDC001933]|uniref:helix-turn-helix domain-containing protein n=1 Tax=Streptomyces sp. NPDC001933 TaxID=3364626 RepID=UPI00368CDA4D
MIGRALGAPIRHLRRLLHQSGGVRLAPQQRSERHLTCGEREEISRGIAAGGSARQLAERLGRSPWGIAEIRVLAMAKALVVQAGGLGAVTKAVEELGGFDQQYEQIEKVSAHHGNFWKCCCTGRSAGTGR